VPIHTARPFESTATWLPALLPSTMNCTVPAGEMLRRPGAVRHSASVRRVMISCHSPIVLASGLCLAAARVLTTDCRGHDILPALKSEAPAAYAAIEAAASIMPFTKSKLFRLSCAGTEPSYLFATLHLSDPRITGFSLRLRAALKHSKIVALASIETGAVLRKAIRTRAAWRRATVARANQEAADRLLDKADFAQLEALAARKALPNQTFGPRPYARPSRLRGKLAWSKALR
jgi:TraB family protein